MNKNINDLKTELYVVTQKITRTKSKQKMENKSIIKEAFQVLIDAYEDEKQTIISKISTLETKYRIQSKDGNILYTGGNSPSWFNIETARKLVNYQNGERIIEDDGINILWEVL